MSSINRSKHLIRTFNSIKFDKQLKSRGAFEKWAAISSPQLIFLNRSSYSTSSANQSNSRANVSHQKMIFGSLGLAFATLAGVLYGQSIKTEQQKTIDTLTKSNVVHDLNNTEIQKGSTKDKDDEASSREEEEKKKEEEETKKGIKKLTFTKEEVAKHRTRESMWVTFKGGVYDVTEFVALHPGGTEKIMLAAGSSLEPFWNLYQQHSQESVKAVLERYRIGNLEGYVPSEQTEQVFVDPFSNEPQRLPILRVLTQKPFNAETPLPVLVANPITSNDFFFVRNHLPVPVVDKEKFRLKIEGLGVRSIELSLEDIKKLFIKHEIVATVQCSGNRRSEMALVKPIRGLDWKQGAIGTAKWGGVLLRDVITYAGFDPNGKDSSKILHIQFEGLDKDPTGATYGASIPIDKILNPLSDVLLAYEMNGVELPRDHGFPLRVIVPGVTGARSVKWLSKVVLSEKESQSHWQQADYKVFPNTVDWHNVNWENASAIQEVNVQSAICEPSDGQLIQVDPDFPEVSLKGYAWSGGGRGISRVDVSIDGGINWYPATIHSNKQPPHRSWAWVFWTINVNLPPMKNPEGTEPIQICVRASDNSDNSQPESAAPIWNLRGLMNNSWHRININIQST